MQTTIDLGIGLRWEESWCCQRYKTALDLGWEHHVWLDYNQYTSFVGGTEVLASASQTLTRSNITTGYNNTDTDLMMGGFVLRLRLDF